MAGVLVFDMNGQEWPQPIRVLVVDDHPGVRKAIIRLLRRAADIQVVGEARNGIEGLELAKTLHPDILLLDIEMPGMDGLQVADELCREGLATKVLIVSGYADKHYISSVLRKCTQGYITKDEAPDQVVEAIRTVATGQQVWLSQRARAAIGL